MELDLQSLLGLLCTAALIGWDPATTPLLPAFGLKTAKALLVSQDRRHLFVTPWWMWMTGRGRGRRAGSRHNLERGQRVPHHLCRHPPQRQVPHFQNFAVFNYWSKSLHFTLIQVQLFSLSSPLINNNLWKYDWPSFLPIWRLVSAQSISIGENGSIPLLALTLYHNHVNSAPKQASLQTTSRPTM